LLAKGVTLYDVNLALNKPEIVVDQLTGSGAPSDPLRFALHVDLKEVGMDLRATTPDAVTGIGVSRAIDPHCKITFDARLNASIAIATDINQPLFSQQLTKSGPPTVEISRVKVDGRNVGCSAPIVAANVTISLVGLERLFKDAGSVGLQLLNQKINTQLRAVLTPMLEKVNAQVKAYYNVYRAQFSNAPLTGNSQIDAPTKAALLAVYDNALRYTAIQGWLGNGGHMLAINIAPRAPLPEVPLAPRVSVSGAITIEKAFGAGNDNPPVDCATIPVLVKRKTGPKPMLNENGALGSEPLEPIPGDKITVSCRKSNVSVINGPVSGTAYSISGLSPGFPNIVFLAGEPQCSVGVIVAKGIAFEIESSTTDRKFLPLDLAKPHPAKAQWIFKSCGSATNVNVQSRIGPVTTVVNPPLSSPVFNPQIQVQPSGTVMSNSQALPPGGSVSINPQPLPPKTDGPLPPPLVPVLQPGAASSNLEKARQCEAYATEAMQLHQAALADRCGLAGPRHNASRAEDVAWCLTAKPEWIASESRSRKSDVDACHACRVYAQDTLKQFQTAFAICGRSPVSGPIWIPNSAEAHFSFCLQRQGDTITVNRDTLVHQQRRDADLQRCRTPGR